MLLSAHSPKTTPTANPLVQCDPTDSGALEKRQRRIRRFALAAAALGRPRAAGGVSRFVCRCMFRPDASETPTASRERCVSKVFVILQARTHTHTHTHTGSLHMVAFPPPDWLRSAASRQRWECCQLVAMEKPCVCGPGGGQPGSYRRWGGGCAWPKLCWCLVRTKPGLRRCWERVKGLNAAPLDLCLVRGLMSN